MINNADIVDNIICKYGPYLITPVIVYLLNKFLAAILPEGSIFSDIVLYLEEILDFITHPIYTGIKFVLE